MSLKLPSDFAKKIAETLTIKTEVIEQLFDIEERKDGYFYAALKSKQFLDKFQFRAMCKLVKDLGGQDYLQGAKAWAVPGPFAKKGGVTPQSSSTSPTPFTPPSTPPFTPLQKVEKGPNDLDEEIVESLKGSSKKIGTLYPILVDSFGNTIDGFHRRKANPNWPTLKVDYVSDPLQLAKARLIANERRNVPAEEKRAGLDQIAKMTGWTPKQIAEDLGWSEKTVYRYLSTEFKDAEKSQAGKAGGEAIAEAYEKAALSLRPKSEDSLQATKPQDMTVGKAKELLDTPAGKEVLEDALKERLAEGPGKEPGESEDEEPLYADSIKWKPDSSESIPKAHEPGKESIPRPAKVEPLLTGYEWTCPECGKKYVINHVDYPGSDIHKHVLEACGE
jgi:ParB-like chromosome segregation protein Spo0J